MFFRRRNTKTEDGWSRVSSSVLATFGGLEKESRSIPASLRQSGELTKGEIKIRERIAGRIVKRYEQIVEAVARIEGALATLPRDDVEAVRRTLPGKVSARILSVSQHAASEIVKVVQGKDIATAQYQSFRAAEQVMHREPRYASSKLRYFSVVVGLGALEVALMSGTYLSGSSGVIAAVATAGLFTTITMGSSVGGGLLARYLHRIDLPEAPSRRRNNQLLVVPLILGLSLVIVGVSLAAGHYRDAGLLDTFDEAHLLKQLLSQPFTLSLSSWGLFLFTMVSSGYGAVKGYLSSDPAVGYEREHRIWRRAHGRYNDVRSALRGGLESVVATEVTPIKARVKAREQMLNDLRREASAVALLVEKAQELEKSDNEAARSAILGARRLQQALRSNGGEEVLPAIDFGSRTFPDLAPLFDRIGAEARRSAAQDDDLYELLAEEEKRIGFVIENLDRVMLAIAAGEKLAQQSPVVSVRDLLSGKPETRPKLSPAAEGI